MPELHTVGGVLFQVDEADVARVASVRWHAQRKGKTTYIYDRSVKPHVTLHRFLLSPPDELEVDHINGDGTDNRRSNLRTCTRSENARNRGLHSNNASGFKGVSWHKKYGKWRAVIGLHGKQTHLGYFESPEVAHAAYVRAAEEMHGSFARTGDFQR